MASYLSSPSWTYDLPLLGFLGLMILGMAQHFVPLFSRREIWSGRVAMAQVSVGGVAITSLLVLPADYRYIGLFLWLLTASSFVLLILMTLRSPELPLRPRELRKELRRVDRLAIPMTGAAILYLLAASAGFFFASLPWDPLGVAAYAFSFLHLFTLGFVTLMVFGVGLHLLPRFLDALPPRFAVKILAVLALPAPLGIALTMPLLLRPADPLRPLFLIFAIAESVAAFVFAGLVVGMWWRSPNITPWVG